MTLQLRAPALVKHHVPRATEIVHPNQLGVNIFRLMASSFFSCQGREVWQELIARRDFQLCSGVS